LLSLPSETISQSCCELQSREVAEEVTNPIEVWLLFVREELPLLTYFNTSKVRGVGFALSSKAKGVETSPRGGAGRFRRESESADEAEPSAICVRGGLTSP
jgi:hypothetical protein